MVLCLLGACAKERVTLAIDGISATVPADFVPMDPERVAALRDAAQSAESDVEVSMVGRKPKGAPMPWMYLQRTAVRPSLGKPLEAGKVLDGTVRELKAALTDSGLELLSETGSVVGDSREVCLVTRSQKTAQVSNHSCLRLWVGRGSKRVHTVSVVCLSTSDDEKECQRVLESRAVTVSDALPLTELLHPW